MSKNYVVLYIEDHPDNRTLVKRFLEFEGFVVHTAQTGLEGVAAASDLRPDILLVDVNLPDISGFEVIKRLNQQPTTKAIPKIAFSAGIIKKKRASLQDPDYFIQKPVDIDSLAGKLRYAIESRDEKSRFRL